MEFQICQQCLSEKPLTTENFHYRSDTLKFRSKCRDCHKARCHARHQTRSDEQRQKDAARYMSTPAPERLWKLAKARAAKKEIEFDIAISDIVVPERCPIFESIILNSHDLHSCPTLDRIDNRLGYVRGNVHVISHRANSIKGFATYDELTAVANYISGLNPSKPGT